MPYVAVHIGGRRESTVLHVSALLLLHLRSMMVSGIGDGAGGAASAAADHAALCAYSCSCVV